MLSLVVLFHYRMFPQVLIFYTNFADVLILTLQGGTTVTIVIGLAMHLLEVPGEVILVRHRFMLLLDGTLALLLIVPQKGP